MKSVSAGKIVIGIKASQVGGISSGAKTAKLGRACNLFNMEFGLNINVVKPSKLF